MRLPGGRGWVVVVLAALVTVAGCRDDGPSGPGTWTGLVRSSGAAAGAVILEVQGEGIGEIEGLGPVRAFARGAGTGAGTWRVVLVTPTPGSMGFRVRVDDVATGAPRAVVLSASDGEDRLLSGIASFSVEISGP